LGVGTGLLRALHIRRGFFGGKIRRHGSFEPILERRETLQHLGHHNRSPLYFDDLTNPTLLLTSEMGELVQIGGTALVGLLQKEMNQDRGPGQVGGPVGYDGRVGEPVAKPVE
jgi:hypothetical protein